MSRARDRLGRDPSSWRERLPVVVLAVLGFGIATYLTLFQVGAVARLWDPIFGAGAERVLESALARRLPVPDASLGALAYAFEAVTCAAGGPARWRRRPWLVLLYGLDAALLGLAGVALTAAQAFVVRQGCTPCLASAAISVVAAAAASREVRASLEHLVRERRRGTSTRDALLGRRGAEARA